MVDQGGTHPSKVLPAPTLFDVYLMVDWSAASRPKQGPDSIWLCLMARAPDGHYRVELGNPPTRQAATELLRAHLHASIGGHRSVLVGFDFPLGYPAGLAPRLGLVPRPAEALGVGGGSAGVPMGPRAARSSWRLVWDELCGLIDDCPDNRNNRFAVAAELNRRISGGPFPFWGCPSRREGPTLSRRKSEQWRTADLAERRLTERAVRRAQPGWKLLGIGAPGGQALVGIPRVAALRDDPDLAEVSRVWPFETGLAGPWPRARALPRGGSITLAEVYPSLLPPVREGDEPKDASQVRTLAGYFARADEGGWLESLLTVAGLSDQRARRLVVEEEGWVLGVQA